MDADAMSTYDERKTPEVANLFYAQVVHEIRLLDRRLSVIPAGSLRRADASDSWSRRIGDLDLLLSDRTGEVKDLHGVTLPAYLTATAKKAHGWRSLDDHGRMMVDAWWCPWESIGPFGFFLTGPQALNVVMRQISQRAGLMLTQYGLFKPVPKPTKTYPNRVVPGDRVDTPTEPDVATIVTAEARFWGEWVDAVGLPQRQYPWPFEREGVMKWLQEHARATRSNVTAQG